MVHTQTPPFGELLRRLRQAAGLTQEELAERAGLSVRGIKALEGRERTRPHRDTVQLLADALQLAGEERSTFEAAARSTPSPETPPATPSPEPVGDFLGARPVGPLVGREEERSHLLLVLDAVAHGGGRLVVLPGEEGVGKTRLAQEVDLEARSHGFLVASGRCYQSDSAFPFAPVSDMLAKLSTQTSSARWRDLLTRSHAVEQLVLDGSVSAGSGVDAERQMVRSLANLLGALAEDGPLALLLDDLQWADEGTIALLQYLARTTRAQPILLLGTYRESDVDSESLLGQTVRDLMREGLVERIPVRRLTPEGTAALVEAWIGEMEGAEEFVEFVHRRSKGTPFFVKRMVLALGGRYHLVRQIGVGGMGRVFEAVDIQTGGSVAAKIMFARTESDVHARLRFEQEAAILATLEHPNIVRVFGTFLEEHASCIVMELLEGQSLGQIVGVQGSTTLEGQSDTSPSAGKGMALPRVQQLMAQVLIALGYAHERGIVHRDIKPDNIMVLPGDRVKVTDFGIARLLRPIDALTTMTSTGLTMGTPLYMAPEQIRGERVDGRVDLYAVGAVLYELVTGRLAFDGDDPLTVAIKHLEQVPAPPSALTPEVPKEWDGVILKALAKDPAQRFQSAAEMEEAVSALPAQGPPVRGRPEPGAAAQWVRGTRFQQFALVAAAVAVLGLIATVVGSRLLPAQTHASVQPRAAASLGAPRPWGWTLGTHEALAAPDAVAVDRQGNVYVANRGNNTVDKFASTGALLARFGAGGTGDARFDEPSSIAVDRQGHIFVVNVGNHLVQELSPTGRVLSFMAPTVRSSIHVGFVAIDPSGAVYLYDPSGGGIVGYTENANGIVDWAAGPSGPGSFAGSAAALLGPGGKNAGLLSGFAVDGFGDAYLADSVTGYVSETSEHRGVFRQWTVPALAKAAGGPEGLAVDGHGTVYVADYANNRVLKLSPDGTLLASWGPSVSGQTFSHPRSVAVNAHGDVYVANEGDSEILKLSSSGTLLAAWGKARARPGHLDNPQSVASDRNGDLFVVIGADASHIQKIGPSGRLLATWGPSFGASGVARALGGLATDRNGNVYATDVRNNQILKLSPRGKLLAHWAVQVTALSGLAVDEGGNVYTGDGSNSRVVELDPSGKVLTHWSTGSITAPQLLAVDSRGNVYVAYVGENLIQRFSTGGTLVHEWGGSGPAQLADTAGIAVDRNGDVYAIDDSTGRLVEFSSWGHVRGVWGGHGALPGQFVNPSGVAVDGRGNVYVADTGNGRIQKLTLAAGK